MDILRLYFNRLIFIVFIGFISCSQRADRSQKIFRYNESSGITSLDPAFARNQANMWMVHQLYNTLVEVDDQMNIKPMLAKRWRVNEDGTEWIFYLRNDVYFHDDPVFPGGKGRRLKAEDVVYSFKRLIAPSTASPGAWVFNTRVDSLQPFMAIDDTTFRLRLKQAFGPLPGILSMQYCSVVPKEAVEKYGSAFRSKPVGTGPFQIVNWVEGQALICKRNTHYFERDHEGVRLPYLDGLSVSFADNKATEFLLFRQKKLDFINDIDASFKDEVLTRSGNLRDTWKGKIVLQKHPYFNIEYIGISMDSSITHFRMSPLSIKEVRQAMNCAIDKGKLMLYLRNSIGTAANSGFIPEGFPSFHKNYSPYPYNPERAKTLLRDAGYDESAQTIVLNTIPQYANLGVFIVGEWEKVGLKVELNVMQKSLLLQKTAAGQLNLFRGSWIGDYPDAENYLSVFYGHNPAPPNYTHYKNEVYDKWYEEAIATPNDGLRNVLYHKMDSLMMADSPVIPLWYDMVLRFVQPWVSGFYPNSLNLLELRRVKKQ